jgi:hypothetical protein
MIHAIDTPEPRSHGTHDATRHPWIPAPVDAAAAGRHKGTLSPLSLEESAASLKPPPWMPPRAIKRLLRLLQSRSKEKT